MGCFLLCVYEITTGPFQSDHSCICGWVLFVHQLHAYQGNVMHVSTKFRVACNVISNIITFFVFNLNKVMKLLDHFKVILSRNKHHSIYTSYFTICFLYLNSHFAVTIKKCVIQLQNMYEVQQMWLFILFLSKKIPDLL